MPKYILATLIFVLTFCASAQIPSGYYNTASGTGFTLKTQIHYIIDNHNERTYNDVWDFISDYELDTYFENDGTILDIYSENPSGTDSYNFIKISNQCGSNGSVEGDCYNREHSFPKSWFYDGYPMYTDIHHLFPTDKIVNGQRSNYPYGEVSSATFTSQNGSKVGSGRSGLGYSGIVFEPIAEFKGDLARAYFYMATRYEDVVNNWSSDMLDGSSDQVFETWALDMLMTWHVNDPVSPKETDRNNNAYNFQGNRNPFVDHPEWVDEIWGYGSANSPLITVTAPSNGLDFGQVGAGNSSASQSYTLSGSNLLGDILISLSAPFELSQDNSTWSNQMTITQANAEAGANNIYVRFSPISDNNQTYNTSILHTSANAVNIAFAVQGTEKTALSSSEDDLFISEYIEGSSNNKALEIFNGTGSAIDMAAEQYSIIRYNNGSETPDMNNGTLNLIGIVNNGGVYVIANPSSSQAILDISNLTSEITFYNGDDAVGLYKNGVLVDLIGVIGADPGTNWNDGNHFTSEKTLVRKANINKGNPNGFSDISLLSSEWDVFDQNTISNLGSHTFSPEPITYQWLGTSDQVWTNSANWQNNNLPSSNSNITVSNGSNHPIISTNVSLNNIDIDANAVLQIESGASLIIMGAVSGNGTAHILRNTTGNLGYSIVGSPVLNANLADLNADFIYDFNGSNYFTPSGEMGSGKGYFVAFDQSSPTIIFEGTPNTGNITLPVNASGDGFNIVANPYAAAISRATFILENANEIDGNIWLWDDGGSNEGGNRGGDYIVVNDIGDILLVDLAGTGQKGSSAFNGNIGSMQGFLVKATGTSNVVFKPSMQNDQSGINDDTHFYRKQETKPQSIKLSIFGNDLYNELIVGLSESATRGMDYALDAPKYSVNKSISFFSLLNETHLAIQALPHVINETQEIPLGFDLTKSGYYEFEVVEIKNFNNDLAVSIFDSITGLTHNLRETASFTFETKASVDNRRFTLIFSPSNILANETAENTSLKISGIPSELNVVFSENGLHELTIFTIAGKVIFKENIEFRNNQATVSSGVKPNQLYLIQAGSETVKFILK